jgi:hypothetical protein
MEKKKALLVIAGRRAMPDVLPLLWLQPARVIVFTSEEGWESEKGFRDIATSLSGCEMEIVRNISAYDLEACRQACLDVCRHYPLDDWDWTFSIGSSPKISGIAGYEAAKVLQIPCWYVDTRHEKLISLIKDADMDKQTFFHIKLKQYMKIQHRSGRMKKELTYRQQAEKWGEVSHELALSDDAPSFTGLWHDKKAAECINLTPQLLNSPLLHYLEGQKLIEVDRRTSSCFFTSPEAASFLGTGDWLEVYVWYEVKQAGFADDYLWGFSIKDGSVENELDLALIYKAQLVIAECKTDRDPFKGKKDYLKKLDAIANLLGGTYVTRVFVTNQYAEGNAFETFREQARQRAIVIVTKEELPRIGEILQHEAKSPTYARI